MSLLSSSLQLTLDDPQTCKQEIQQCFSPRIICLSGPTASGKTALALQLANYLPCEIINVDSALVYRDMNIGTAKPTETELNQVPHHLINILDPTESFSVADFCEQAKKIIIEVVSRGNWPILVGGTMMYFRGLIMGLDVLPSADAAIRAEISAQAHQIGWPALHQQLAQIDPKAAARIQPQDQQRIQRALEVHRISGHALSDLQHVNTKANHFLSVDSNSLALRFIALQLPRALLHQRIFERLNSMFELGFVDEVRGLRQKYDLNLDLPSMRCVGYRQVWQFLEGEIEEKFVFDQALVATRQLAKRQCTWLRHWPGAYEISLPDKSALQKILQHCISEI